MTPSAYSGHLVAQIAFHHQVVVGACAFGHDVVGHVGDGEQNVAYFVLNVLELVVASLVALLDGSYLGLDGFGFIFFALFHQAANLCSELVELCSLAVALGLCGAALYVELQNTCNGSFCVEVLFCQLGNHAFRVGIYNL